MSPPDSATTDDLIVDDDFVTALGFQPARDLLLEASDDEVANDDLTREVLDVTGDVATLHPSTKPAFGKQGANTNSGNKGSGNKNSGKSANSKSARAKSPRPANGDASGDETEALIVLDRPTAPPASLPSAEVAPGTAVPVSVPPRLAPGLRDSDLMRIDTTGRGRPKLRARKVRRVIRHVDPWSVLTFSVIFHLCLFAALLLGGVLVWSAAEQAGTIEQVESFIRELADLDTFEIDEGQVFRAAVAVAGLLTLASSVIIVLLTVVFNLISDLVGGIRVTVIEEERVRAVRRDAVITPGGNPAAQNKRPARTRPSLPKKKPVTGPPKGMPPPP